MEKAADNEENTGIICLHQLVFLVPAWQKRGWWLLHSKQKKTKQTSDFPIFTKYMSFLNLCQKGKGKKVPNAEHTLMQFLKSILKSAL